jgi:hypothetical protein
VKEKGKKMKYKRKRELKKLNMFNRYVAAVTFGPSESIKNLNESGLFFRSC